MSDREDKITLRVSPVPSDEEMAVIGAVVAGVLAEAAEEPEPEVPRGGGRERWARAGRCEVLRPVDRDGWA